jgi:hypothetical protein
MEAMAAARRAISSASSPLFRRQRSVRQEEITAKIIKLAAGRTVGRAAARWSKR